MKTSRPCLPPADPPATPPPETPREHHLGTLVREHEKALLAYTEKLLNDHHLAEDIVQETLVRAWRHTDRLYDSEGSVRGWLLTVARNLVIDRCPRRLPPLRGDRIRRPGRRAT